MPLASLLYISHSLIGPSSPEMNRIAEIARARNAAADVTGFLYHDDATFLQALEGPEDALEAIFASIRDDTRHDRVRLLARGLTDGRRFAGWSLGLFDGAPSSGLLRLAFGDGVVANVGEGDAPALLDFLGHLAEGREDEYRLRPA